MRIIVGILTFILFIFMIKVEYAPEQNIAFVQTKKEPDKLQIYDIDEGYLWVDYIKNIKHHKYIWSNLKQENGYLKYEDENYTSIAGVDVSYYQGEIDWNKVKQTEIEFAILRLGYRGYGNGKLVVDKNYYEYLEGATNAGLQIGIYFFSQAINEQEAVEEAEFVINNLQNYKISYPICFDTEKIKNDTSRAENLTVEERTNIAKAFCNKIEEAGYETAIYANAKWLTTALNLKDLQQYKIWYADYQENPIYPYEFAMWQYTQTGTVQGINTNVDINLYFKEKGT